MTPFKKIDSDTVWAHLEFSVEISHDSLKFYSLVACKNSTFSQSEPQDILTIGSAEADSLLTQIGC